MLDKLLDEIRERADRRMRRSLTMGRLNVAANVVAFCYITWTFISAWRAGWPGPGVYTALIVGSFIVTIVATPVILYFWRRIERQDKLYRELRRAR